ATLPIPAIASHVRAPRSSASGRPWAAATGPTPSVPVRIPQASGDPGPMIGLAREALRTVTAQATAAPRPPRTAITSASARVTPCYKLGRRLEGWALALVTLCYKDAWRPFLTSGASACA